MSFGFGVELSWPGGQQEIGLLFFPERSGGSGQAAPTTPADM